MQRYTQIKLYFTFYFYRLHSPIIFLELCPKREHVAALAATHAVIITVRDRQQLLGRHVMDREKEERDVREVNEQDIL